MADILLDMPIDAPVERVFDAVSTPEGLDAWWTLRSQGRPRGGEEYVLYFGEKYDWRAKVSRCVRPSEFELLTTRADADWMGTRVGFRLEPRDGGTWLQFAHTGWPAVNEHFRISCNCWALYLRILRRHVEHGEMVPYDERLSV